MSSPFDVEHKGGIMVPYTQFALFCFPIRDIATKPQRLHKAEL